MEMKLIMGWSVKMYLQKFKSNSEFLSSFIDMECEKISIIYQQHVSRKLQNTNRMIEWLETDLRLLLA